MDKTRKLVKLIDHMDTTPATMLILIFPIGMLLSGTIGLYITIKVKKHRLFGLFLITSAATPILVSLDAMNIALPWQIKLTLLGLLFLSGPFVFGGTANTSRKVQLIKRDIVCLLVPLLAMMIINNSTIPTSQAILSGANHYDSDLYKTLLLSACIHAICYILYTFNLLLSIKDKESADSNNFRLLSQNQIGYVLGLFTTTILLMAFSIVIDHSHHMVVILMWLIQLSMTGVLFVALCYQNSGSKIQCNSLNTVIKKIEHNLETPQIAVEENNSQVAENDKSLDDLSAWIIAEVSTQKIYLDDTLSLKTLADKLSIKSYLLSESLNKDIGKSFYQFINEYRVNEAKAILKEKQNIAIADVYHLCGFSSRSTFYNIFKKHVGCTPSQYKKSMLSIAGSATLSTNPSTNASTSPSTSPSAMPSTSSPVPVRAAQQVEKSWKKDAPEHIHHRQIGRGINHYLSSQTR